ncbi:uncharacterized protein N7511_009198 [Penicillium nucicola]|uniref:uncharacterized protein n=1 Tax=Penicillium nucicola TaxID=1850975 RepID=UPI002544E7BF|nr:uncharacterized protein N7511_009198 [Penicillium nucicola]KAJ5747502.1 hypothetical protein N7511_009198 [Penicillium nucicola]
MAPAPVEQDPAPIVTDGNPSSPSYSDHNGGERPVRQQLQDTNLDASINMKANNKRSHGESDNDAASEADAPPKKRSRESTPVTSSRSRDSYSLKKRSHDESDNDTTSEADAPPKKRSRECTPVKSSGAQPSTSNTSSGAEQPETETATAGSILPPTTISPGSPRYTTPGSNDPDSPDILRPLSSLSPLPDYEDSPSPAQLAPPVSVPLLEDTDLERAELETTSDESVNIEPESDNGYSTFIAQPESAIFAPLPEETVRESIELETTPDDSVIVKLEGDADVTPNLAQFQPTTIFPGSPRYTTPGSNDLDSPSLPRPLSSLSPLPDYEDSSSPAQLGPPASVPLPEDTDLERAELETTPDDSVIVKIEGDIDCDPNLAQFESPACVPCPGDTDLERAELETTSDDNVIVKIEGDVHYYPNIAQLESPVGAPLPEATVLERNELEATPDDNVIVKLEGDADLTPTLAQIKSHNHDPRPTETIVESIEKDPKHFRDWSSHNNPYKVSNKAPVPRAPEKTEPETIFDEAGPCKIEDDTNICPDPVSMINLHNHNVEQGQVDGPDKDVLTKVWVEECQPTINVSISTPSETLNIPETPNDRWDLVSGAPVYHKTVHCEATITVSIEGHAQIPVKVPFDINLSFEKPECPGLSDQSNGSESSTSPSILRGRLVSTPDSRIHARYGHRARYSAAPASHISMPDEDTMKDDIPSHISTSDEDAMDTSCFVSIADENTMKDDIASHISTSDEDAMDTSCHIPTSAIEDAMNISSLTPVSDEIPSHGHILPSSHLPRIPEPTTYTDHFGFGPINNPIFTQETENLTAPTESIETKTVPPDANNLDERKPKMNQTFSSSAFGNTSTDSPFTSAFKSSTTSTSVFGSSMTSASAASPFTTSSATAKQSAIPPNASHSMKPASTSAFASSSLSAFAGSDDSPFGNLTAGTSVFGNPTTSTGFSAFTSAFPATARPSALTSFASPNVTSSFGTKGMSQPLGAAQSDNEDSENEQDNEGNGNDAFEAEKTDERFVEQPVETGEEDEETVFANKGKLYCFENKQWKERGVGTFKVNVKSGPDGKRTARMIMRADGALRVMLNSAVFKGMHFGDQQGGAPAGRRIFLASQEDGKVANVLLQVSLPLLTF